MNFNHTVIKKKKKKSFKLTHENVMLQIQMV